MNRLRPDDRRIEVICNRFAAEFLVPDAAFTSAFAGMVATEESAAALARRFHVSREFIFRKFLDRGLITSGAYTAAADRWVAERKSPTSGGNSYYTTIAYLGREYIELALSQFHRNRIDEVQLAEALNVKPRNLSTLEEYFMKGAAA